MKNKIEYKIVDMRPDMLGLVPVIESSDGKRYVPSSFFSGMWMEEVER